MNSRFLTRSPCHRVKKVDVRLHRTKTIFSSYHLFIYFVLLKRIPEGNGSKMYTSNFPCKNSVNLSNVANYQNDVTFVLSMNLCIYQLHYIHCKIVHALKYSSEKYDAQVNF